LFGGNTKKGEGAGARKAEEGLCITSTKKKSLLLDLGTATTTTMLNKGIPLNEGRILHNLSMAKSTIITKRAKLQFIMIEIQFWVPFIFIFCNNQKIKNNQKTSTKKTKKKGYYISWL
jgi:hypothetical protein